MKWISLHIFQFFPGFNNILMANPGQINYVKNKIQSIFQKVVLGHDLILAHLFCMSLLKLS